MLYGAPWPFEVKDDTITWGFVDNPLKLIRDNVISIISYQIGFRLRQENFGSTVYSAIEEPNTDLVDLKIKTSIREALGTWESRISAINIKTIRDQENLNLLLYLILDNRILELALTL